MIQWLSPWAFLLFIPLVVGLIFYYLARNKKRPSIQFSGVAGLKKVPRTFLSRLTILPFVAKVVAIGLMIVAMARPQSASTKVKRNVEGIDIMIALDVSDSMLIEDMTPENRLEASKATIKKFIEGRVSDRIGLVVFSGEAYTRVPLTLDYSVLKKSLAEVKTTRNIKMGTAIGVALANSVGRLKDSTAKSRVVIFLTDGENNSGTIDPDTALEIARGYDVRIYSIGMGVDGQAQLPIYLNSAGGKKIKQYRPIHSKINEALLGKMADETGGKYYRATTTAALENVFKDIDKLEKTEIQVNQYTKYNELYQRYLLWALILYVASVLMGRSLLRRSP